MKKMLWIVVSMLFVLPISSFALLPTIATTTSSARYDDPAVFYSIGTPIHFLFSLNTASSTFTASSSFNGYPLPWTMTTIPDPGTEYAGQPDIPAGTCDVPFTCFKSSYVVADGDSSGSSTPSSISIALSNTGGESSTSTASGIVGGVIAAVRPRIDILHIESTNGVNPKYAVAGDTIVIRFNAITAVGGNAITAEPILMGNLLTDSHSITPTSTVFETTYLVPPAPPLGIAEFTVRIADIAGNLSEEYATSTDGSFVIVTDGAVPPIAPPASPLTIATSSIDVPAITPANHSAVPFTLMMQTATSVTFYISATSNGGGGVASTTATSTLAGVFIGTKDFSSVAPGVVTFAIFAEDSTGSTSPTVYIVRSKSSATSSSALPVFANVPWGIVGHPVPPTKRIVVNYLPPTATVGSSSVPVACSRPATSSYPLGITIVTCYATGSPLVASTTFEVLVGAKSLKTPFLATTTTHLYDLVSRDWSLIRFEPELGYHDTPLAFGSVSLPNTFFTAKPPIAGRQFAGAGYEVRVFDHSGASVATTTGTTTIRLHYPNTTIAGKKENSVRAYKWDPSTGSWDLITLFTQDFVNNKISFDTRNIGGLYILQVSKK